MVLKMEHVSKVYNVNVKSGKFFKDLFSGNYKKVEAVKDVCFEVEKGEIVGYIGLNGAGKSTTIKMMTGILKPTSGEVYMFDDKISHQRLQKNKRFSVVFGQRSNLWYDLPVLDTYKYFEVLYEVPEERFKENLKKVSRILEIEDLLNIPVRKLSLGQKMKCELGAALLSDPDIIFLDEPTIGLDIFAKDNFLKCIRQINEELNTTIILTSHDMSEIEKLCSRIIILDKGSIIFDGTIDEIKNSVGDYYKVCLTIENYDKSKDIYGQSSVYTQKGILEINIDKTKENMADIIKFYFDAFDVREINIENNGLEELIKVIYGRKKND